MSSIKKTCTYSQSTSRLVLCAALVFAVTACATTPEEKLVVPSGVFNADAKYAVLWIKPCNTKLLGRCDADDGRTTEAKLAIHGAPERVDLKQQYEDDVVLSASIARLDASSLIYNQYLVSLKVKLAARQLNAVVVAKPLYEGVLEKRASSQAIFNDVPLIGATQFPLQLQANTFDYSPIYEGLDVDYLVVMELLRFNIERHYGPTGKPVGNPQAVSAVRLTMHERTSNDLVFDDYSYKVAQLEDEWEEPPHFRSLEKSLTRTLQDAVNAAQENLLSR